MIAQFLEPRLELMREEYVLVQAWKKTASYIRSHNWYSDTLALDRAAVNLPRFLEELAEQLRVPEQWKSDPLRIVPAPKSQQWHVERESKLWVPLDKARAAVKLRPLAHVSLRDQVASTAIMLCLADRVESLQGDPRSSITDAHSRERVISYGNRLFCDSVGDKLRHRWGSAKLYRAYYDDYRTFLSRPEIVAEVVDASADARVMIVDSDLRQFYDRVSPRLLAEKVDALADNSDESSFFSLMKRILNWTWHVKDLGEVSGYAREAQLSHFSAIALPQGLVSAGFFANLVLLDFDQAMRESLRSEIAPGVRVEDACRYVDDLRIVLTVKRSKAPDEVSEIVKAWLQELLDTHAHGLKLSQDKTRLATFKDDDRPVVRQSRRMTRIQRAVSGGFGAPGGEEILVAVQGLIRAQERLSEDNASGPGWPFSPVPDVRDDTVSRFAAARFRRTYRSLRPLLDDRQPLRDGIAEARHEGIEDQHRGARTKAELDDEARAFAAGLIEKWVKDPSNVRLLRIGLDLWPSEEVLRSVLDLLRPFTDKGGRLKNPRRVAWYCLAEIFRAGATETGFVEDDEELPAGVDIDRFRTLLRKEALRLASLAPASLPWYLRQQVMLFLTTCDPQDSLLNRLRGSAETNHYREVVRYLTGEAGDWAGAEFASLAILARRALLGREAAVRLAVRRISTARLEQIAERDPGFALEILASRPDLGRHVSPRVRDDLCLERSSKADGWVSLAQVVLEGEGNGRLRNELSILHFASSFLLEWPSVSAAEAITPADVLLRFDERGATHDIVELKITSSRVAPADSMYRPPKWCPREERWRFQLGYLLRFILAGSQDFTRSVRRMSRNDSRARYRKPDSHWYQRLYGLFNAQSAFGDDWLPISDWIESLLSALLSWPGCRIPETAGSVNKGLTKIQTLIKDRLRHLAGMQGARGGPIILPLRTPRPTRGHKPRPLRACVVQTVFPTHDDFVPSDLALLGSNIRRKHRNHLSAALAAVDRMLELRETHNGLEGRLDWLILPELAVHPRDVGTHLVPFARAHKTVILAGLTYEELFSGRPLVNSALWVIPTWSATNGLQVVTRRQGKQHLAPLEEDLNSTETHLQGFRPCQWLVGYEWSNDPTARPLWLTASVCYDATDLRLAADLRHHSDVLAIPALNKDVSTFDQMALALHYHMFQLVIVANNGAYGGSNAYSPYQHAHVRQVFHLHGQPQAAMAFLELEDIAAFVERKGDAKKMMRKQQGSKLPKDWKYPPAGF